MRLFFVLLALSQMLSLIHSIPLRIASYNIQSGSGMDYQFNLSRTADAISQFQVHLIGLQEVDNFTQRHYVDETSFISQQANLPFYTFGAFRPFQNGQYGVSVLSSLKVVNQLIFYYSSGKPRDCAIPKDGDFCQGIVGLQVVLPTQQTAWFLTTHLGIGLNNTQQTEEVKQLNRFVADEVLPKMVTKTDAFIIVSGDFNSSPQSTTIQTMMKNEQHIPWKDLWNLCNIDPKNQGYTFNSANPFERIDYLFMLPLQPLPSSFTCEATVINTQASDHRPLLVELHL